MRGHQGRSGPAGRGQGQDQGHVGRPATHSRSVSFSEHTSSSAGPTAFGHSNGAGTSNAVRSSLMTRMPDHARQNTRPSAGSASVRLAPSPGNSIFSPSHSDPSGYTPRPAHHFDPGAFAALLAPSDSLTATALPSDLSAAWANFSASAPSLAPNIAPPMPLRSQDDLDLFNAYNAYMELTRPATDLGTTPYTCAYCDKSFGRSDVRAKHVATMHADQPAMPAGSGVGGEERGRRGSTAVSGSREEEDDEGEEDGDEVDEEALRPRCVPFSSVQDEGRMIGQGTDVAEQQKDATDRVVCQSQSGRFRAASLAHHSCSKQLAHPAPSGTYGLSIRLE